MDIEGSNQINLTNDGSDGKEIIPNPTYDPSGRLPKTLRIRNGKAISNYSPVWSPNGREIAYDCYVVEYQNGKSINQSGEIHVISFDGDNRKRAVTQGPNDAWPSWSPDGKKIAFQSVKKEHSNNWQIYIVNSDGSGLIRLTNDESQDRYPSWALVGGR